VIGILSYQEHTKSIRPSALLEVYLFFTLLFDAVRARTLWLVIGDEIAIIFTTSLALKLLLLLLEAKRKNSYLASTEAQRGPEETSGAFGRVLFLWLISLINTGYRKILSLKDLYPLDEDLRSETVSARFEAAWFRCMYTPVRKAFKELPRLI
jgi:ATP-binding cassette, subfamily C (CFTR/MRP), member 1